MEIGNIIIMVLAGILMLTIIGGITISYRFHIARASINLLLREVGYNIGFTYEKDGEGLAVILFKKEHPHGPVL